MNQLIPRLRKRIDNLHPHTRKTLVCLAVIIAIGVPLGGSYLWRHSKAPLPTYNKQLNSQTALESHIAMFGDIYWGRAMYDWSQASSLKEKYPFARLNEFEKQKYDAWIGNFECPSVPSVKQPIGFDPGLVMFNCDSTFLPEFAKWFDIVSLSNNHTQNQNREAGLIETRKALDQNHIQYFGHFNAHVIKDDCEVVAMPARAMINGQQKTVRLPFAMCGYAGVYYTVTDKALAAMKEYAKYMPVIAYPHMGVEYQAVPDDKRRTLYHKMIDNGADAVIGNHPHWAQPTEVYKGKLIAYSMGNFIFDQDFSEEVTRSAAFDLTMNLKKGAVSDQQLQAWTALGDACATYKDVCLATAAAQNLQRLPLTFKYEMLAADTNHKITKPANRQVYNALLERLDWRNTQRKLGQ